MLLSLLLTRYGSKRTISTVASKVSPAAYWHANNLGISLNLVKGSGPKGHILKSDILNYSPDITCTKTEDSTSKISSFLLEYPKNVSEIVLNRCLNSISAITSTKINYKTIPEISSIQVNFSHPQNTNYNGETIKNLIKIYLTDFKHLLL